MKICFINSERNSYIFTKKMSNLKLLCRIAFILYYLFSSINSFTITSNHKISFSQRLNYTGEIRTNKALLKSVIPSYMQEFLTLSNFPSYAKNSQVNKIEKIEQFLEKLLNGVTSHSCKVHVTEWFWRILPSNLKDIGSEEHKWVVQMIDSWGKLPEGILSGHVNSYGDFDECIQISVKDLKILNDIYPPGDNDRAEKRFEGQYCTVYISNYDTAMLATPQPIDSLTNFDNQAIQESVSIEEFWNLLPNLTPGVSPSFDICMPNSCSKSEVQQIAVNSFYMMYASKAPPDVNLTLLPWPVLERCSDAMKPPLSTGAIAMIALLAVLITLSLGTGALDYWNEAPVKIITTPPTISGTAYKYLMTFSLYTNLKELLSTRKSSENFGCLHGIRFLSTAWVVLVHTYDWFIRGPQWNRIDLNNVHENWAALVVINGTFSVDTLFLISGTLATYNALKMLDKNEGKFNILMFYVHKYIRFTPTYAILIGIAATLYSYMGNGPQWHYMELYEQRCKENWWKNILYINNLVDANEMCHPESWYLANDMQFYILLPFLVYPIWKWEFMGVLLLGIYTVLSCITPVLVSRYANNPPAMIDRPNVDNMQIYVRPWSRISTFLVGIWLGGLLHKIKGLRFRLPLPVTLPLSLLAAFFAGVVVFAIQPWYDSSYEIPRVAGYFYAGLSRLCWALAISWLIFTCVKGYGGIINKFLSWKVFIPLGRLSFCVYLISYHLQSIFHLRLSVPIKVDAYTMINLFFAHLLMSYLLGFFCCLLFECPFVAMQKIVFEGKDGEEDRKEISQTNC